MVNQRAKAGRMSNTSPSAAEVAAIQGDARTRLAELRNVRAVLLPDADDQEVLSELSAIDSQIRGCEQALRRATG